MTNWKKGKICGDKETTLQELDSMKDSLLEQKEVLSRKNGTNDPKGSRIKETAAAVIRRLSAEQERVQERRGAEFWIWLLVVLVFYGI